MTQMLETFNCRKQSECGKMKSTLHYTPFVVGGGSGADRQSQHFNFKTPLATVTQERYIHNHPNQFNFNPK